MRHLLIEGVKPSQIYLTFDKKFFHKTLLEFFCEYFPHIDKNEWQSRFDKGLILDENSNALAHDSSYLAGQTLSYYRDVGDETIIPFLEKILWVDEHLIVVDKPHFLPVIPTGKFVRETLLTRLRLHPELQHLNIADISPIHRLDKDTAGVMLFSHNSASRSRYQQMFEKRQIKKTYEAIAPTRLDLHYPYEVRSRLVRGDAFFLSKTVTGEINAITKIYYQKTAELEGFSHYQLEPITGKKHQLRVHLSELGMPILNDNFYPIAKEIGTTDFNKPLKLLAKSIEFIDPISQRPRVFHSQLSLS